MDRRVVGAQFRSRRVMADKPFLVRWLNKPLVAGLVGIIAGKLLNRAYDR